MIIVGEKGSEHAVNETCSEDFVVRSTTFALEETSGETTERGEFFFVLNLKGHEVHALAGFLSRHDCCKQHGASHAQFYRSIGLLGEFTCL